MHDGSSAQNKMSSGPVLGPSIEQLREMAARQQQQIEMQQQQLVAKEQRLKYLKQQEYQHHQMASEYDRLRRWVYKSAVKMEMALKCFPGFKFHKLTFIQQLSNMKQ